MKRAALLLLTTVLLATVGLGVARAAGPKPVDPDNPWVRLLAEPDVETAAVQDFGNGVARIYGNDRYETAAAISAESGWTSETAVAVYLASGQNFPDALAGAASTQGLGPVLLTFRDSLPPSTRAEIQRLQPCFVIAFGGPAAISDAVLQEARSYTVSCEQ